MHKLFAIAVSAALMAVVGLTITRSEHAPAAARAEPLMPSILQIMTDAKDLPSTPFVAP